MLTQEDKMELDACPVGECRSITIKTGDQEKTYTRDRRVVSKSRDVELPSIMDRVIGREGPWEITMPTFPGESKTPASVRPASRTNSSGVYAGVNGYGDHGEPYYHSKCSYCGRTDCSQASHP